MKKRIISMILAVIMLLSLMPMTAFAGGNPVSIVGGSSYSNVQNAVNAATNGQTIQLNTTCTENITIPEGKTVTLDLNGNILKGTGTGSVITVNGELTLTDSKPSATHIGDFASLPAGGVITGGNTTQKGGGVNVNGGKLYMYNGTLTGNNADKGGGGVYVGNNGEFTMFDSTITGNTAIIYSGGVYVEKGTLDMTGNSIISKNNGGQGAGVCVGNTSAFTMSGSSEIIYNKGQVGGGVRVLSGGTFSMSGNSKIAYNEGTIGGGVGNNGTFTMTGGSIDHNTATPTGSGRFYVGGVYDGGTVTLGGAAVIKDNTADGTVNNVFLANNKYITLGNGKSVGEGGNGVAVPTEDFSVGITTQTAPVDGTPVKITTNGASTDTKYFISDNADYYVKFNTDHLELTTVAENEKYPVWVAGTQINIFNKDDVLHDGGTVSFTPATETVPAKLTLNGATIAMSGQATGFGYGNGGIKSELENLTISIKGTNKIGAYSGTDMAGENSAGLEATIQKFTVDVGVLCGSGNVVFVADEDSSLTIIDYAAGIQAKNVTFSSDFNGTLKVLDLGGMEPQPPCAISATGDVTFNGGTFDLTSYNSNGISAKNIFINDCKKIKTKGKAGDEGRYAVTADTLTIADTLEVINSTYTKNETTSLNPTSETAYDGYVVIAPASHIHAFTYTVDGNKLTATCTDGCSDGLYDNPLTLTLTAPASLVYDGNAKRFTFADGEAVAWEAAGLELPTIIYYLKRSGQDEYMLLLGTPRNAGDYMVKITAGEKAAQVTFTIEKATPYIKSKPDSNDIIYGKKLADSTLAGGYVQVSSTDNTQVGGLFEWTEPDTIPAIADSDVTLYSVTFTPADENNYNPVSCQITITVTHTHNPAKVNGQAPTEAASGWKDYYECDCGDCFEDENGTAPIENLAAWKAQGGNGYIAPLVHTITPVNGKDATDTEAGYKPYYECKICGKYYEDAEGVSEISNIDTWKAENGNGYLAPLHGIDDDHNHICDFCDGQISECKDENKDHKCDICGVQVSEHKGVLVEGVAATHESAGFKSYYKCDCGKFFEDANCKVEISDIEKWKAEGGNGYLPKLEKEPNSPQTGDTSDMILWIILLALSFAGLCACLVLGKKRKNKQ